MNTVVGGAEFDLDAYLAALKRPPIPSGDECERVILDIVRNRRSIETGELVAQRLGAEADDPVIKILFDQVFDHLISPDGPLEILAGDLVVHVESLTAGIVATHWLAALVAERRLEVLDAESHLRAAVRIDPDSPSGPGGPGR